MTTQKQNWTILFRTNEFIVDSEITIREEEFHYIANVLRLKVEDEIELTNCEGKKALGRIKSFNKKEVKIDILNVFDSKKISPEIHIYLALPKPSTLEEVVASASELGLDELHLFRSEKCMSKAPVKIDKLIRISDEAVRISKSAFSAKIFEYENLFEVCQKRKNFFHSEKNLNLFCDESHVYENKVTNMLLNVLESKLSNKLIVNVFVGPEGSFTQKEREFILQELNCFSVSLGANILRVSNAVCSVISIANQVKYSLRLN